jgi:hypothetical protein
VDLLGRGDLLWVKGEMVVDAGMVLSYCTRVVVDGMADVQGIEGWVACAAQPGKDGVDQPLRGKALKVVGYETASILA